MQAVIDLLARTVGTNVVRNRRVMRKLDDYLREKQGGRPRGEVPPKEERGHEAERREDRS